MHISLKSALLFVAAIGVPALSSTVKAEPLIWGVQIEQLDHRFGDDTDVQAWDADAMIGTDELKFI